MRRRRAALITLFLLAGLVVGMGLWVRSVQRQYALNRQLIAALVKNDTSAAITLVKEGADPNTRYTPTPIPTLLELVKQLFHRLPAPTNNSPTALLIACGALWIHDPFTIDRLLHNAPEQRPQRVPLVQAMIQHGAKVNARDQEGGTALTTAIESNNMDLARVLLLHGADANAHTKKEPPPLIIAIWRGDRNLMRLLLDHGAEVNHKDEGGRTPLMEAVSQQNANAAIVLLLLDYGAEINTWDYDDYTALQWAVVHASLGDRSVKDIIRQLLAHGANPNLADITGLTPLALAREDHRSDLVALLKQAGAKK